MNILKKSLFSNINRLIRAFIVIFITHNLLAIFIVKTFSCEYDEIMCHSSESHQNYPTTIQALNELESQRDNAFIENNSIGIERITREISHIISKEDILINHHILVYINSILKTRHLFPGKVDILADFYDIDPFFCDIGLCESSSSKEGLALIIVTDSLANRSITDPDFHADILNEDIFTLKNKVINEIDCHLINKSQSDSSKIEIIRLLNNILTVKKICKIEQTFAPIITFSYVYNELLVNPYCRGYEVIGMEQYAYWPRNLLANERQEVQKVLCKNEYCGKFKPLSLTSIQINTEAMNDFPILANREGSFVPFSSKPFDDLEPIEFILISGHKSTTVYNRENLMRLKQTYATNPLVIYPKSQLEFQYYAEQGISMAEYRYAKVLFNKVNRNNLDLKMSFEYFKRASSQGNSKSLLYIGTMYFFGLGVTKNEQEAARWYHYSAQQGSDKALYYLGVMYQEGIGILKNEERAANMYQQSANKGNIDALNRLALCYDKGIGVIKDEMEAVRIYQIAASHGSSIALDMLGLINKRLLNRVLSQSQNESIE